MPKGALLLLFSFFILTACSDESTKVEGKEPERVVEQKLADKYANLVVEKNKEIANSPISLSSYGEEMGLSLKQPAYAHFAANGSIQIEGSLEYTNAVSPYVWVVVKSSENEPAGYEMDYFVPIINNQFQETIHFFNGEGAYEVSLKLPSTDQDNYYYDTASFKVENVNPETHRDIALNPYGYEAGLSFLANEGYVEREGTYLLEGKIEDTSNISSLMIRLNKESDSWNTVIPVRNGQFSYEVPLYFGEGVHKLEVMVPDSERDNYYNTATDILIHNLITEKRQPVEYSTVYLERGINLLSPLYGGEVAEYTYSIKGTIEKSAEFAPETTHLYIQTTKGEDKALEVIPVNNFQFDDSFYLRFGPGEYQISINVPIITYENSDYYQFHEVARFNVVSKGTEDKRNLLPARGIQSTAPEIIELSKTLTKSKETAREKAKAIYDFVAKTVSYDVEKLNTNDFNWDDSALKTLDTKTGVCQDYAYLTIALLRASNIEARMIEGFAPERHAWVEALVDGTWITMDPTWGAGYVQNNQFTASYSDKYFDPNLSDFEKTHNRTGITY